MSSHKLLSSKLKMLSKEDLIDLLLLSKNNQKTHELRNIKMQIHSLKHNGKKEPSPENTKLCSLCGKTATPSTHEEESSNNIGNNLQKHNEKSITSDDELGKLLGVYMAYSIFHGYLNLIIPRTGTTEPHLEELMKDYESSEKITFPCYKLFLLIPKSVYCPPTFSEVSNRIEECNTLKEKLITRAGILKRSYKNSVYKINQGKETTSTFVVAEYATPLKTYKEVFNYNYGEDSEAYKKSKDNVVIYFYQTLKKILQEHEECTNYCELVFFDDKDGRDVADILLERIEEVSRK